MTVSNEVLNLFPAPPAKPLAKSDITARVARAIIDAEAEHRNAKTDRLRLARLASQSMTPAAHAEKPKRGSKQTGAELKAVTRKVARPLSRPQ